MQKFKEKETIQLAWLLIINHEIMQAAQIDES